MVRAVNLKKGVRQTNPLNRPVQSPLQGAVDLEKRELDLDDPPLIVRIRGMAGFVEDLFASLFDHAYCQSGAPMNDFARGAPEDMFIYPRQTISTQDEGEVSTVSGLLQDARYLVGRVRNGFRFYPLAEGCLPA